uniref:Reverse transcriptase Ty1/copia-type domain-containing protein n=1 Tax=Solanum lycopersicum TaxID=4081 RepID=A0A3Q7HAP2_SOLLC
MSDQDYKTTSSDHCVFAQKKFDSDFIILLLYVDDILVVGKNTSKIDELKDERKIYFSQKKYTECVLERFSMKNAKPFSTPLSDHMKLRKKMFPTTMKEK